ncbi:MAG: hypothetical protein EOO38_20055 [Cytophagaceae bacterium]|nr:MAG: hypothetical protein EOO38_20055 [Cytophagaceae bacterium]
MLPDITEEVKNSCETLRARIQTHSVFAPHAVVLEHGLDRFLAGDYISATAILYPRIEGIMRSLHAMSGRNTKPKQDVLADAAVYGGDGNGNSSILLLPDKFRTYLEDVYFDSFDPDFVNSPSTVSRNSVGHGVAPQTDYNEKAATIGLLIIDQMSYFLPDETPSPEPKN